ncbi:hypothetical protein BY996DRAFT_6547767 [Phakopsora pachyrhizi]|nr:hypothetical protein BY996DRAFT_6547767 [Phakopsora pachyrhizi]
MASVIAITSLFVNPPPILKVYQSAASLSFRSARSNSFRISIAIDHQIAYQKFVVIENVLADPSVSKKKHIPSTSPIYIRTSSFGKPPTIAKAEIYSQTFLLEEKEELNIDSLTDEITNGSFANNEAKAKIESTSISTYLPPPMILRPIEDVHSPKSEVAGDQVIRSAWPSRQINIHSALSGLNFEKQKAKTEQGFIIQPENEQRQSRSLKRQRFKTDAYETTSTTLCRLI